MALEVIGAGLPRTGTESLKYALEHLGYRRCYHMNEVVERPQDTAFWEAAAGDPGADFDTIFEGYRAAVDFPAMYHWRTLVERYPAAKVVLTVRDPGAWYASLEATILTVVRHIPRDDPDTARRRRLVARDLVGGLFEGRADEASFMRDLFERHRRAVHAGVPADRLLEFDVRQGWQPLCDFLDRPLPAIDFPRGNATAEFRARYLNEDKPA